MIKSFASILLLSTLIVFLGAFQLPKNILKKVDKEIIVIFNVEAYTLEAFNTPATIDDTLKEQIKGLYSIINDEKTIGYAFVSKAPSKTDEFDYLVLLDTEFIVKKTKVLVYREDYGGEIGSKRWLRQFEGLNSDAELDYGNDIVPISGATISAVAMTRAMNELFKSISILKQHQPIQ